MQGNYRIGNYLLVWVNILSEASFGISIAGELNLIDITHLINYVCKSGLPPKYDFSMGDTGCNGVINILDIIRLIKHLYQGGPEPCIYGL